MTKRPLLHLIRVPALALGLVTAVTLVAGPGLAETSESTDQTTTTSTTAATTTSTTAATTTSTTAATTTTTERARGENKSAKPASASGKECKAQANGKSKGKAKGEARGHRKPKCGNSGKSAPATTAKPQSKGKPRR